MQMNENNNATVEVQMCAEVLRECGIPCQTYRHHVSLALKDMDDALEIIRDGGFQAEENSGRIFISK